MGKNLYFIFLLGDRILRMFLVGLRSVGTSSRAQQGLSELNPANPWSIVHLVTQDSNHRKVIQKEK